MADIRQARHLVYSWVGKGVTSPRTLPRGAAKCLCFVVSQYLLVVKESLGSSGEGELLPWPCVVSRAPNQCFWVILMRSLNFVSWSIIQSWKQMNLFGPQYVSRLEFRKCLLLDGFVWYPASVMYFQCQCPWYLSFSLSFPHSSPCLFLALFPGFKVIFNGWSRKKVFMSSFPEQKSLRI